jgi:hypothetical protein
VAGGKLSVPDPTKTPKNFSFVKAYRCSGCDKEFAHVRGMPLFTFGYRLCYDGYEFCHRECVTRYEYAQAARFETFTKGVDDWPDDLRHNLGLDDIDDWQSEFMQTRPHSPLFIDTCLNLDAAVDQYNFDREFYVGLNEPMFVEGAAPPLLSVDSIETRVCGDTKNARPLYSELRVPLD